jgi:hypothetical protein
MACELCANLGDLIRRKDLNLSRLDLWRMHRVSDVATDQPEWIDGSFKTAM